MVPISVLLLLTAASYVHSNVELSQPSSVVIKPGDSLTLTCKVSGYSVSTCCNYATGWIRQPEGKPLEWITHIWEDGDTYKAESLKSKFSISKDPSSSTVTLSGQNLQAEDSAVYYCARVVAATPYFDYWGKGTQVTVSSGATSIPTSIYTLSQCGSESGFVTLGCVTSGFFPAGSQTFKWTDDSGNAISDLIQYPDISKDGKYSKISQIRVKAEDWDAKKTFTCEAGTLKAGAEKHEEILQSPSLYLMKPTSEEINQNKTATFACLATDFSPREHTFKWKKQVGDKEETLKSFYSFTSPANGNNTATSYLQVPDNEWEIEGTKITCVFQHKSGEKTKSATYNYISDDCETEDPGVDVKISAPSIEDLLVHKEGWVTCKITGKISGVLKDGIEWRKNGDEVLWDLTDNISEDANSITIKLKVRFEEWQNGTEFSCFVPHSRLASGLTENIKRTNGGSPSKPSVFLMAPPEHESSDSMTLTCYAKDFYPKEVFVSWLADDDPMTDKSKQNQTDVIYNSHGKYSVYSQLTISRDDWDAGVVFSCVVYHESSEATVRMITRSMDKASQKANIVSLNMNLPQCRSG